MAERFEVSNRLIHQSTPADKSVTMFHAASDAEKHILHYSNAGHNPPFLILREGATRLINPTLEEFGEEWVLDIARTLTDQPAQQVLDVRSEKYGTSAEANRSSTT